MMKKILLMTFTIMIVLTMNITAYAANTPLDGTYNVGITLTGGSGKVSAKSPTSITVSGGKITAKIVLSSSNYTYMIVNGTTYYNAAPAGQNSTFIIPISALDTAINVTACTEAMSAPHEVDYTIKLSSEGKISKDSVTSKNTDKNTNQGTNQNTDKNTNQNTNQTTVKSSNDSKNTTVKDTKSNATKEVKKDSESTKPAGDTDSNIKNEEVTEANTTEKVEKNLTEPSKTEELEKESVEVQESSSKSISGLTKAIIGVVVIIAAGAALIILKKRK